jgi:hypothetical protein
LTSNTKSDHHSISTEDITMGLGKKIGHVGYHAGCAVKKAAKNPTVRRVALDVAVIILTKRVKPPVGLR